MSNSVVTLSSFNLLFLTQVLTVLTSTIKYNEYVTDKGDNISIPCIADGNVMWVKENGSSNNTIIQTGKYLVLTNVSASDRGVYVCFAAVTPRRNLSASAASSGSSDTQTDDAVSHEAAEGQESQNESEMASSGAGNTKSTNASTTSMLPMPNDAATGNAVSSSSIASKSTVHDAYARQPATPAPAPAPKSKHLTSTDSSNHNSSNTSSSTSYSNTNSSSSSSSTYSSKEDINSIDGDQNLQAPITPPPILFTSTLLDDSGAEEVQEFQAFEKINLTVRTPPGPVTQLFFKASTILGFLVWRFNKTNSGGYPVRSFTAEFRNISYDEPPYNKTFEHQWNRMDPINIAPNVRQMEVYRLEPNTTYEFRIWANNHLGSGDVVTTNVTTLPETKEEDLIRLIQPDLDNFDPRIWIVAVSIVLGTFVILAIGLCIVLSRECYQSSQAGTEPTNSNICISNQSYQTISPHNQAANCNANGKSNSKSKHSKAKRYDSYCCRSSSSVAVLDVDVASQNANGNNNNNNNDNSCQPRSTSISSSHSPIGNKAFDREVAVVYDATGERAKAATNGSTNIFGNYNILNNSHHHHIVVIVDVIDGSDDAAIGQQHHGNDANNENANDVNCYGHNVVVLNAGHHSVA